MVLFQKRPFGRDFYISFYVEAYTEASVSSLYSPALFLGYGHAHVYLCVCVCAPLSGLQAAEASQRLTAPPYQKQGWLRLSIQNYTTLRKQYIFSPFGSTMLHLDVDITLFFYCELSFQTPDLYYNSVVYLHVLRHS